MNYYEEKLREIINSNSEYYPSKDKDVLAKYFPELKESEDKDEMIRQCLIEHIKCNKDLNWSLFQWFKPDTIIAWLEKNKRKFEESEMSITESQPQPKFNVGDKVTIKGDNTIYTIGIIAPDKTCWLKHGSSEYGWATFGVLKHYVE